MTYRMHIKHIDIEIISCDTQTFKYLQITYHVTCKAINKLDS